VADVERIVVSDASCRVHYIIIKGERL
jgi:hypothetical protein